MSAEAAKKETKDLVVYVEDQLALRADKIGALLQGSGISPQKFQYMALQQLATKPEVFAATRENPGSFVASVCTAAEQGLDFSRPNEAHLVPIPGDAEKGRKAQVVLFRGYKGIAKMAKRSPRVADIDVQTVYANDKYQRRMGSTRGLTHEPPSFGKERGEVIGFYAIAYLKGAAPIFDEMTADDVEKHAKRFIKSFKGPFSGIKKEGKKDPNFVAYGLKTVLIRLCYRKLDLSSEFGQALQEEFEATGAPEQADEIIDAEVEDISDQVAARKEELKKQAEEAAKAKHAPDELWGYVIKGGAFAGKSLGVMRSEGLLDLTTAIDGFEDEDKAKWIEAINAE